ncbi:MAG: sphinganine-1-phosphate aldolase [Chlamydiales bacterium]|jgi:sphinganine-1-phosphate aldolase
MIHWLKEFLQKFVEVIQSINASLHGASPLKIILTTTIVVALLPKVYQSVQPRWGETEREKAGRLTLNIPFINSKYNEEFQKNLDKFRESTLEKWKAFGEPVTEIPEKGWSEEELVALIDRYSQITNKGLKNKYLSGTVYSKCLEEERGEGSVLSLALSPEGNSGGGSFTEITAKLRKIFPLAFAKSYLWNSLHSDEFAVASFIDYQVVRMVGDMFGGEKNEVMGFVTSGGTESLMLAARSYRDWGIKNRGHAPGEGVIIAGKSVHASIMKASSAYFIRTVLVDTDESGAIDIPQLKKVLNEYGNSVVAIVGSAPSYPTGKVDPIREMAALAKKCGCGMHVDSCLGGFVINNLKNYETDYLKMPGVTSLSADTHKNGWAPKGSSVLVTKDFGDQNLAYYSFYSIPEWSGGVYGTPKDAGSQSAVQSFNAFLAMLAIGQDGYKQIASEISSMTQQIAEKVKQFDGKLKLLNEPEVNVVAFTIDEEWGLEKGATYAFAHEMSKRGVVLNTLKDDAVHFCVTGRVIGNKDLLLSFEVAVTDSLRAVKRLNDKFTLSGERFPGDAGMYCALEAALSPKKKDLSVGKYAENFLLGEQGSKDAVRTYFLGQQDPYQKM